MAHAEAYVAYRLNFSPRHAFTACRSFFFGFGGGSTRYFQCMIEMSSCAHCISTVRIQSNFTRRSTDVSFTPILFIDFEYRHCFGNPMSNVHPRHTYPIHKLAFASKHLNSVLVVFTAVLLVRSEN